MALNNIRQYVGARYVPKFYQNSINPNNCDWEKNKAYEAMVIVTYNGSSYTSKIPVPSEIGNPADNPTYWVLTGNYNGQVEQYRDETVKVSNQLNGLQTSINNEVTNRQKAIVSVENKVNDITKKKTNIILFGDSWADTRNYGTNVNNNPAATRLKPILEQLFPGTTVHNYAYGGTSFTGGVVNFNMQLDEFIKENIDPSTILFVILMGGVNQIKTDITTTKDQAHSFFDNVKKYVYDDTPIYWFQNFSMQDTTLEQLPVATQYNHWRLIDNSLSNRITATNVIGWFPEFKPDMLHPTYGSYLQLAINICMFIKGNLLTFYPITINGYVNNDKTNPLLHCYLIYQRRTNGLDVIMRTPTYICTALDAGTTSPITFEKPVGKYYNNAISMIDSPDVALYTYMPGSYSFHCIHKIDSGLTDTSGYRDCTIMQY